jgi:hypothetical protein
MLYAHLAVFALLLALLSGCGGDAAVTEDVNSAEETAGVTDIGSNIEAVQSDEAKNRMKKLRQMILTVPPKEIGFESDEEFPLVYGVVLEFKLGESVASIVALRGGEASLYTTSTFGIIGGYDHETVRRAAKQFVRKAAAYKSQVTDAKTEFPYPPKDQLQFYLLTYAGVKVIRANEEQVTSGEHPLSGLFSAGNDVLTQLRICTSNSPK